MTSPVLLYFPLGHAQGVQVKTLQDQNRNQVMTYIPWHFAGQLQPCATRTVTMLELYSTFPIFMSQNLPYDLICIISELHHITINVNNMSFHCTKIA